MRRVLLHRPVGRRKAGTTTTPRRGSGYLPGHNQRDGDQLKKASVCVFVTPLLLRGGTAVLLYFNQSVKGHSPTVKGAIVLLEARLGYGRVLNVDQIGGSSFAPELRI